MNFSSPPAQGQIPLETCRQRAQSAAPNLWRRMAAFLYEGVVLFGVVMTVGFVYSIATQQTHGLQGRSGMQVTVFLALALYFIWFWTHGGQTLAMRSWQLRLVNMDGGPITLKQALFRFVLSWLWFVPSLLLGWLAGWHETKLIYGIMVVWVGIYALLSRLHPQCQFWHDGVCGTRLIDNRNEIPNS